MAYDRAVLSKAAVNVIDNTDKNVFIMMRYSGTMMVHVEAAVRRELPKFGLNPVLAKDAHYLSDLWENTKFCMHHSCYGIAVFDHEIGREINPNISIEIGYMLAQNRRCLLLKEMTLGMPTDFGGLLYRSFDGALGCDDPDAVEERITKSIADAIRMWALDDLGLKPVKPPEIITGPTLRDAVAARARRIAEIVTSPEATNHVDAHLPVLRVAATMSSLAISPNEEASIGIGTEEDWQQALSMLLEERSALERWLDRGFVRLIISPEKIVQNIKYFRQTTEQIKGTYIKRYGALIDIIAENVGNPKFQVVYVPANADHNTIIWTGDAEAPTMIVGVDRLSQTGFNTSKVIFDPQEIELQIGAFDDQFRQAMYIILGNGKPTDVFDIPKGDANEDIQHRLRDTTVCQRLKKAVIAHLYASKDEAVHAAKSNDPIMPGP